MNLEEFEELEVSGFGANAQEDDGFLFIFERRSRTVTDPTLQYDYSHIEGVNISDVYQMYLSLLSQTAVLVVEQEIVRQEQEIQRQKQGMANRRAIAIARLEGEVEYLEDDQAIEALENGVELTQATLHAILDSRGEDIEEYLLSAVIANAELPLLESIVYNKNYRDEDYLGNTDFGFILNEVAKNTNISRELIYEIFESDLFVENLQNVNGTSQHILESLTANSAVPADIPRNIYENPAYPKTLTMLANMAGNPSIGADFLANIIEDDLQRDPDARNRISTPTLRNVAANPNAGQENFLRLLDIAHDVGGITSGRALSIVKNPTATHEVFDRLLSDEALKGGACPAMFDAIINHPNATRADRLLSERRRDEVRARMNRGR